MEQADRIVETHALVKVYGDGAAVRALDGVDLALDAGEMVAIMGPSGSGKSTLLHLLGGLDQPTSGQVIVAGQDLATVRSLDAFRARTVGFVFQLHNLLPTLTALENVEVPMRGQPLGRGERRKRAIELLELVGLSDRRDHLPAQLSGGQRQRVAIARALANRPRLILADEPTGNLDTAAGEEIMRLLNELNESMGTTVVVVTHDRRVARATRRILTMRDGQITDDHAMVDPLTEDLRELGRSPLGQSLLQGRIDELARAGYLSPEAERLVEGLREMVRAAARP
ncbi:MAG: ABC transporter ATP-binding protein [Anaerolineaceae bacterium]|nr:ABC transporter ATP-binding protein [Anaerolineaceae bacterium]